MGYTVLEAATGKKAIDTCKRQDRPVDLLISDLDLPDLSGTEVALAVSKANPKLPILFVSANPMNLWSRRDRCNFRRSPSALVHFLENPFRLATFQSKIGELCGFRGMSISVPN